MVRIGFSRARTTISAPSFSSPLSFSASFSTAGMQRSSAVPPPGNDALGHGRPGGVQGVLDAALLLLHVGLGGRPDADDRHAAGQLRQPFAELLLVVLALGLVHLGADLLDALLDVAAFLPAPLMIVRAFLLDAHRLGLAELVERRRSPA